MKTLIEFIESKPHSLESTEMIRYIKMYQQFSRRTLYAKKLKYDDYRRISGFLYVISGRRKLKIDFDKLIIGYAKELKRQYRLHNNPDLWEKRRDKYFKAD